MIRLMCGDCLEILPTLTEKVDAIITDLPYGTTACSWDSVIPFAPMWEQVRRLLKPRGVFVTTASQPFTSRLVMSNLEWFKYCWIWEKDQVSSVLNAKKQPLRNYEDITVFSQNGHTYNPQGLVTVQRVRTDKYESENYGGKTGAPYLQEYTNYPRQVIPFCTNARDGSLHPTQKPVALYEYLILTYTDPGDTVLDFCFGSGTTGVACVLTGRNFIGIEKERNYFEIGENRIAQAQAQPALFV